MIAALAALLPAGQQSLSLGFIVFLRVGAVMALLPAFGEHSVPARVRLALALAFSMVIAPAVAGSIGPVPASEAGFLPYIASEVAVGLSLGMILRLLVMVLQIAGQVAAQATSLSQIFGGVGGEPQPAMAHLLVSAGLALAVMSGLHVRAAEAMILSYDILPPARMPDAAMLAQWGIGHIARGFGLAVTLAMPFVIASLIYNLALGIINRAMPQLMVAFVGAPAITAGGLVLMALAMPAMLNIWGGWMTGILANPYGAAP
ncbi:MAG: flagellar biosynthetic protein FliR [Pseudomonadota bacterium]|nr:flagellar biosynthetic protein FliR [Pseudomonadota bacterium]